MGEALHFTFLADTACSEVV